MTRLGLYFGPVTLNLTQKRNGAGGPVFLSSESCLHA
jgi:hypothetical protein